MGNPVENCPNCGKEIKSGLLGSNAKLSPAYTDVINYFNGKSYSFYCEKCGNDLIDTYKGNILSELSTLEDGLAYKLQNIPVVTIQNPANWDYSIKALVTAQTVSGTGLFSEAISSFTDFFGMQSGRFTNKLLNGEELCLNKLRMKAVLNSADAVIATAVHYAEVGGNKGMLMVCMFLGSFFRYLKEFGCVCDTMYRLLARYVQ